MNKLLRALCAASVFASATPLFATTVPTTCNPSSLSLIVPNASACAGYYSGNVLNGSPTDVASQQAALASLGYTFNGNFSALSTGGMVITSLINGNQLSWNGMDLVGPTYIGIHWGNVPDGTINPLNNGTAGNESVFYLVNMPGQTFITLPNTQGFSNAVLYATGAVPEPATWIMMMLGFGCIGWTIKRRAKLGSLPQVA